MKDLQTLESQLAQLLNKYSLLEIVIALKNLVKQPMRTYQDLTGTKIPTP